MAIVGNQLNPSLQALINSLQIIHGKSNRTPSDIDYLNNNNSWIKVASSVSVTKERLDLLNQYDGPDLDFDSNKDRGLAQNFVLFNGVSSIQTEQNKKVTSHHLSPLPTKMGNGWSSAYGFGGSSQFGIDPMPGVESLDIKYLNRGSTKKIQLKIKCFNRNQFNIIDNLYLRLGFFILIEFGKSKYVDPNFGNPGEYTFQTLGETVTEKEWFSKGGDSKEAETDYYSILSSIKDQQAQYNYHYDGVVGKITNFNWSFNSDGSYDVTVDVISMGDVIESLKSNITPPSDTSLGFITELNNKSLDNGEESPSEGDEVEESPKKNAFEVLRQALQVLQSPSNAIVYSAHKVGIGRIIDNSIEEEQFTVSSTFAYNGNGNRSNLDSVKKTYGRDGKAWQIGLTEYVNLKDVTLLVNMKVAEGLAQEGLLDGITANDLDKIKEDIKSLNYYARFLKYFSHMEEDITLELSKSKTRQNLTTENTTLFNNFTNNHLPGDTFYLTYNDNTIHYYLKFSYLLGWIQKVVLPKMSSQNSNIKKNIININLNSIPIYHNTGINHYSTMPEVCLINSLITLPETTSLDTAAAALSKATSNSKSNVDGLVDFENNNRVLGDDGKGLIPTFEQEFEKQSLPNSEGNPTTYIAGNLQNLYVNLDYIIENLEIDDRGDMSVYSLLDTLCSEINKSLGGVNNIEVIVNESTNTIDFIDSTPIPGAYPPPPPVKFEVYGLRDQTINTGNINNPSEATTKVSNFVRKAGIKTTISKEYASMITVGSTQKGYVKGVEAASFSQWNRGCIDVYKTELSNELNEPESGSLVYPEVAILYNENTFPGFVSINDIPPKAIYSSDYVSTVIVNPNYDYLKTDNDGEAIYRGVNSENIRNLKSPGIHSERNNSIQTEFYKFIHAQASLENKEADKLTPSTVGFLPFNLELGMDGLSGFLIYQTLHVRSDFLPSNYPETLDFVITKVDHKISRNDWETKLSTIATLKGDKLIPIEGKNIKTYTKWTFDILDDLHLRSDDVSGEEGFSISTPSQIKSSSFTNYETSEDTPKLQKAVLDQSDYTFNTWKKRGAYCAGFSFQIAYKLKEHLETSSTRPIAFTGNVNAGIPGEPYMVWSGGNADAPGHRKRMRNLGLYDQVYLGFMSVPEAKALIKSKSWNYGDMLNYYAPHRVDLTAGMHTQIYTNEYSKAQGGSGWTTSMPNNFGIDWVYPSSKDKFKVYAYKVKSQYLV